MAESELHPWNKSIGILLIQILDLFLCKLFQIIGVFNMFLGFFLKLWMIGIVCGIMDW